MIEAHAVVQRRLAVRAYRERPAEARQKKLLELGRVRLEGPRRGAVEADQTRSLLEATRPEWRQPGEGARRRRLGQRVVDVDHRAPGLLNLLLRPFDGRLALLELLAGDDAALEELPPLVAPLDGRREVALLQRKKPLEGRPVLFERGHDLGRARPGRRGSGFEVGRPGRGRGQEKRSEDGGESQGPDEDHL